MTFTQSGTDVTLSVGLEDVADLVADLEQAFRTAADPN